MWGELSWGEFSLGRVVLGRVVLGRVVFGASCPDPLLTVHDLNLNLNLNSLLVIRQIDNPSPGAVTGGN